MAPLTLKQMMQARANKQRAERLKVKKEAEQEGRARAEQPRAPVCQAEGATADGVKAEPVKAEAVKTKAVKTEEVEAKGAKAEEGTWSPAKRAKVEEDTLSSAKVKAEEGTWSSAKEGKAEEGTWSSSAKKAEDEPKTQAGQAWNTGSSKLEVREDRTNLSSSSLSIRLQREEKAADRVGVCLGAQSTEKDKKPAGLSQGTGGLEAKAIHDYSPPTYIQSTDPVKNESVPAGRAGVSPVSQSVKGKEQAGPSQDTGGSKRPVDKKDTSSSPGAGSHQSGSRASKTPGDSLCSGSSDLSNKQADVKCQLDKNDRGSSPTTARALSGERTRARSRDSLFSGSLSSGDEQTATSPNKDGTEPKASDKPISISSDTGSEDSRVRVPSHNPGVRGFKTQAGRSKDPQLMRDKTDTGLRRLSPEGDKHKVGSGGPPSVQTSVQPSVQTSVQPSVQTSVQPSDQASVQRPCAHRYPTQASRRKDDLETKHRAGNTRTSPSPALQTTTTGVGPGGGQQVCTPDVRGSSQQAGQLTNARDPKSKADGHFTDSAPGPGQKITGPFQGNSRPPCSGHTDASPGNCRPHCSGHTDASPASHRQANHGYEISTHRVDPLKGRMLEHPNCNSNQTSSSPKPKNMSSPADRSPPPGPSRMGASGQANVGEQKSATLSEPGTERPKPKTDNNSASLPSAMNSAKAVPAIRDRPSGPDRMGASRPSNSQDGDKSSPPEPRRGETKRKTDSDRTGLSPPMKTRKPSQRGCLRRPNEIRRLRDQMRANPPPHLATNQSHASALHGTRAGIRANGPPARHGYPSPEPRPVCTGGSRGNRGDRGNMASGGHRSDENRYGNSDNSVGGLPHHSVEQLIQGGRWEAEVERTDRSATPAVAVSREPTPTSVYPTRVWDARRPVVEEPDAWKLQDLLPLPENFALTNNQIVENARQKLIDDDLRLRPREVWFRECRVKNVAKNEENRLAGLARQAEIKRVAAMEEAKVLEAKREAEAAAKEAAKIKRIAEMHAVVLKHRPKNSVFNVDPEDEKLVKGPPKVKRPWEINDPFAT